MSASQLYNSLLISLFSGWNEPHFVLYYKRLERSRFRWPVIPAEQTVLVIEYRQLQWLLSGLSIEQRLALPAVPARVVG